MGRARAYRVFVSYLVSYLLILLVPVTVMTFLVYDVFLDKLQEETLLGNMNTLDKVRYAMDEQLKRVEDTTYQLMIEDNRLSQYRVSDEQGFKAWGMVREIKKYQKMNPFVQEIWLHYYGEETVYTSSSVYSVNLLSEVYQFADWTKEQMVKDLNTLSKQLIMPPAQDLRGQERYLRIAVPVLPNKNKPYATLVYLIKESSIHQLLSNYISTGGSTWVLDPNNRVITGLGNIEQFGPENISKLSASQLDEASQRITIGGKEQYLFIVKSEKTGWKYVTLLPVSHVLGKVEQAKTMFIYGIAAVLLIGCVIVFLGMRWNYGPIRLLKLETEHMFSPAEPMHELEIVRHALSSLTLQNRQLDEKVRTRDAAARKQLVLSLIKGDFASSEELRMYSDEMGLPIQGSLFRVVIVQLAQKFHERDRGDLSVHSLESFLPEHLQGLGMEHIEKNKYIFIMVTDEMDTDRFMALIFGFQESLRSAYHDAVTLGVGCECSLPEVSRSYLEANTAIGYCFLQGVDRVIDYKDIPSNPALDQYPFEDMESLGQSIRTGNGYRVEAILSSMIRFIREKQPPLIVARSLCLDIIRTVNRTWNELEFQDQSFNGYPDVFTLEQLDTIDDFEQLIKSLCFDLCEAFKSVQEEVGTGRSVDQMIEYIKENYKSCDFTLQNMALHFKIALPNLSQYFKDQTGVTLLDYTTSLRMEAAKQLLTEQDLPLKVIAEQVGYYNVSSFIRRFKQLVGVTPGEYRIQFKE
ncbi:helix-turn-helix domain-containing protein [Paenibacillus sp. OAS669]|uniref:helix-turn-helix domain-containing protein n=1 Tax=Paenibacillus sp. OAS669 TaxID=2663821 RepID=UPI001789B1D8|nr:helix-turn-helix domain-containing protein [Paenibacillus sp. OAS669]MBE1445334.1 AraC-like DNA-binding protein [Paenibacillus sp. OAS669]